METTEQQKAALVDAWGADFWKKVPAWAVKEVMGLYSVVDAAASVGQHRSTFNHFISSGQIPAPTLKLNKACYYTSDEIVDIKLFFDSIKDVRNLSPRVATKAEIAEMRRLWSAGVSQTEIAKRYEVNQGTVSRLVNGKRGL